MAIDAERIVREEVRRGLTRAGLGAAKPTARDVMALISEIEQGDDVLEQLLVSTEILKLARRIEAAQNARRAQLDASLGEIRTPTSAAQPEPAPAEPAYAEGQPTDADAHAADEEVQE
jgi:hypothetical protein